MSRVLDSALGLLLLASPLAAQDRFAEAARVAEQVRQELGAPALSVAVVSDGHLAWSAGFGLADVENQVGATPNTVYRIASVSKPIGAIAVMQLVEQGRVHPDDPVSRYLPFPHSVTLRQIMTHTSGIRHYRAGENPTMQRYESVAEAITIFKNDPLEFAPGTGVRYSTYAYNMLAGVVEAASGLPFERYMNERILEPAGMTQTYLEYAERLVPHRARLYVRSGDGELRNAGYADLSSKWTGGGIISTVEDLARLVIALDAGKLLRPQTESQMHVAGKLANGTPVEYGMGWELSTDDVGRRFVDKYGAGTGGGAYLLRLPARKFAVAILFNIGGAGNIRERARRIAYAVLDDSGAQEAVGRTNTLTDAERAAGWRLLFDGRRADQWRGYGRPDMPRGWQVEDGTLALASGGEGRDIITREQFSDFELALEWKIEPGGNSGIFYRAAEGEDWIYQSAPEMQVLDDERHSDGQSPLTSAGSNFGLHPAPRGVVRPAGEWNAVRILVRGSHVEHWLNGVKVVEYELGSGAWARRVAESKFAQWPRYGKAVRGHIGLQDHGNRVWFRNIKVREIR